MTCSFENSENPFINQTKKMYLSIPLGVFSGSNDYMKICLSLEKQITQVPSEAFDSTVFGDVYIG